MTIDDDNDDPLSALLDPFGGPDEPDPDFFPAGNARHHGDCGTCGGKHRIPVVDPGDEDDPTNWDEPEEVTCFACGGTGRAADEKLCASCRGEGCADCSETGYSVECPHEPPETYWWSDPWIVKY